MVLDVSRFRFNHPGGTFLIEQNIGRDISKFFYGGYSLENYDYVAPNAHTNIARMVVNTLVIARLTSNAPVTKAKIQERTKVNDFAQTITFKGVQPTPGVKRFYKELTFIGKHYLVYLESRPEVKRHYTVSNCMKKEVYLEYVRALNDSINQRKPKPISEHLLECDEDTSEITITCKNYKFKNGLSTQLHTENEHDTYHVEGPMGKGLQVHPNGVHIAFTAGTGVIVFLDLVAHLARKNL